MFVHNSLQPLPASLQPWLRDVSHGYGGTSATVTRQWSRIFDDHSHQTSVTDIHDRFLAYTYIFICDDRMKDMDLWTTSGCLCISIYPANHLSISWLHAYFPSLSFLLSTFRGIILPGIPTHTQTIKPESDQY